MVRKWLAAVMLILVGTSVAAAQDVQFPFGLAGLKWRMAKSEAWSFATGKLNLKASQGVTPASWSYSYSPYDWKSCRLGIHLYFANLGRGDVLSEITVKTLDAPQEPCSSEMKVEMVARYGEASSIDTSPPRFFTWHTPESFDAALHPERLLRLEPIERMKARINSPHPKARLTVAPGFEVGVSLWASGMPWRLQY